MDILKGRLSPVVPIKASIASHPAMVGHLEAPAVIIHADYENLDNKPQIEGVTLIGDKSFEDLNLQRVSNAEIEDLFSNL